MAAALGAESRGLEQRGPRIGDAASLWNFTPAPGWTKEEAQTLKLCLMKHGVGRWIQILETGLLPGKLIQQLNGQTQRLLGQQSLAAFTGLQVDIDRIRADNDRLMDAERKNGLVINSGPNLTKQQKLQLQEAAKAKYGLSEAELAEVEEQLQELLAQRQQANAAGPSGAQCEAKAAAARERTAELLARDTSGMSKEEKIGFLMQLHAKLQQAAAQLARAAAGAAQRAAAGAAAAAAAGPARSGSFENEGAVANAAPMQLDAPAAAGELQQHARVQAAAKPAAAAGKAAGGKRKSSSKGRRSRAAGSSDEEDDWQSSSDEEDDWQSSSEEEEEAWKPAPRAGGGRGRRGAAAAEAMDVDVAGAAAPAARTGGGGGGRAAAVAAAAAADAEQLVAMGFSRKQARDALEECGGDVEAAIEWLVANCV